jgi:hypothetical protein
MIACYLRKSSSATTQGLIGSTNRLYKMSFIDLAHSCRQHRMLRARMSACLAKREEKLDKKGTSPAWTEE